MMHCLASVSGMTAAGAILLLGAATQAAESLPEVAFQDQPGKVVVIVGGQPVATYVYVDDKIPRPYFAQIHGPGGIQLTRNFPPIEGQDATDHATMHPGIWLAFGDLDGTDIWRNKGRVVHEQFLKPPAGGSGRGTFIVRNRYETAGGEPVCREECRRTFLVRPEGYHIDGGQLEAVREGPRKLHLRQPLELYQLDDDLGEQHNVAQQHPDTVKRLRALAAGFDNETRGRP